MIKYNLKQMTAITRKDNQTQRPMTTLGMTINKLMHILNGNKKKQSNGLKVGSWNCDRAFITKEKKSELEAHMNKLKLDICFVSEVTATKTRFHEDHLHKIKGYKNLFPNSWNKHGHARSVLYIKNNIANRVTILREKMTNDQPDFWLKMTLKTPGEPKQKVTFGFYYREWKGAFSGDNSTAGQGDRLKAFVDTAEVFAEKGELWILGDINVDWNKITKNGNLNEIEEKWKTFVESSGLTQLIRKKTRERIVAGNAQTSIIDHLITNRDDLASKIKVIDTSTSDHSIVAVTRISNSRFEPEKITVRNLNAIDESSFNESLQHENWEGMDSDDVNVMTETITKAILNAMDKHAPQKSFRPRERPTNLGKDVEDAIEARESAYKEYKRVRTAEAKETWLRLKNKVIGVIKNKKTVADEDEFKKEGGAWKILKRIQKKSDDNGPPSKLNSGGKIIKNKKKLADILNNHFVDKTLNNRNKVAEIKEAKKDPIPCPIKSFAEKMKKECDPWKIDKITETKMEKMIDELKSSSGSGVDGIPNLVIKLGKKTLAKHITKLVNTSIQKGDFPDSWRTGLVTALHKKDDKLSPDNYRPITIVCKLSLILERVVNDKFKEVCKKYNLIDDNQHAYSEAKGCDTALITMYHSWVAAADRGEFAGILMTDMRDAFGLIDWDLFLSKLSCTNPSQATIKWFRSYMTARKQRTKMGNKWSEERILASGLPQGSILACLGFLFYTSDLPKSLKNSTMVNFADDSTSTTTSKDPIEVIAKLESDAERISDYMISNKLLLAPEKTVLVLGASKQKPRCDETKNLKLKIGGLEIGLSRTAKLLGIIINQDLNSNDYLFGVPESKNKEKGLLHSLSQRLHMIRRIPNCPTKVRKLFVTSLFGGKLNYCIAVWGGITAGQLKTFERLQIRAARLSLDGSESLTGEECLRDLSWLTVEHMIIKHTLRLMHSIRSYKTIPSLEVHLGHGRSDFSSKIPVYEPNHIQLYERSFTPRAIAAWNSLPDDIRGARGPVFKRKVHRHLLNLQNMKLGQNLAGSQNTQ